MTSSSLDLFLETLFHETVKDGEKKTKFWHGGNLAPGGMTNDYKQKGGRYEYGPGLYLTTHFDTAAKYAKGSRKIYLVELNPSGTDIADVFIPRSEAYAAIKEFASSPKTRKELVEYIDNRFPGQDPLRLDRLVTLFVNIEAIKPSKTGEFRQWIVSQGADYKLVSNPFGWHETMCVLFNTQAIKSAKTIRSDDPEYGIDL